VAGVDHGMSRLFALLCVVLQSSIVSVVFGGKAMHCLMVHYFFSFLCEVLWFLGLGVCHGRFIIAAPLWSGDGVACVMVSGIISEEFLHINN